MNQAHIVESEGLQPLLRNRNYMLLMGSQLVSNMGEWLYIIALLTLVGLKWQAAPWEITAMTLCMAIPVLIGGPVAGWIGDKYDRKKIMVISDVVRAFILIGVLFAGNLIQIYILLIVKGLMDVLFSPAKSGKIKEIVDPKHIDQAVTISSSIEQMSKIIGPSLGGLLMALFGIQLCFIIDAGAFIVSALFLLGVPGRKLLKQKGLIGESPNEARSGQDTQKKSFFKEIGEGLKLIYGMPLLLGGVVTICAVMLVLQMADSQIVTLFRLIPDVSDDLLGYCISASGLGTLIAAMFVRKLSWSTLAKMGVGSVAAGLVFAVCAVVVVIEMPHLLQSVVLFGSFFLAGAGGGFVLVPFQMLLMKRTPEHMTSRVFGTVNSLTSGAVIIGPTLGGALVTGMGPVPTYIVAGLGTAAVGAALLLCKSRIERKDEDFAARSEGLMVPETSTI
ncbi:MFS transporter [Paenibacillus lautus]|uniref:MFS transporter n=1 Tax=Paenibacillus lautus TaxID=1401 RepID=UPI002DBA5D2A|nr:MFS transporter [Paenibacillus lautus]MEC0254730.1 MFS transporter [Paenibacillus lautus]